MDPLSFLAGLALTKAAEGEETTSASNATASGRETSGSQDSQAQDVGIMTTTNGGGDDTTIVGNYNSMATSKVAAATEGQFFDAQEYYYEDDRKPAAKEVKPKGTSSSLAAVAATTAPVASLKPPPPSSTTATTATAETTTPSKLSGDDLIAFLQDKDYQLKGSRVPGAPFGYDFYRLLEDAEAHKFSEFVHWSTLEGQDAVCIPNKEAFLKRILKHCPSCNYSNFESFKTALGDFGFRTAKYNKIGLLCMHLSLQRGKPEETRKITHRYQGKRKGDERPKQRSAAKRKPEGASQSRPAVAAAKPKPESKQQQRQLTIKRKRDDHSAVADDGSSSYGPSSAKRQRFKTERFAPPAISSPPTSKRSKGLQQDNKAPPTFSSPSTSMRSRVQQGGNDEYLAASPSTPTTPNPLQRPPEQRPKLHVHLSRLVKCISESQNLSALLKQQPQMDTDVCCACRKGNDKSNVVFRCEYCGQSQHWSCLNQKYEITPINHNHKVCQDCIDLVVDQVARTKVTAKNFSQSAISQLPFSLKMPPSSEDEPCYDLTTTATMGAVLHRLLEDASTQGFEFLAAWRPGGHSFEVYHRPLFMAWILGKDYSLSKFQNFSQKLKFLGFVRVYNTGEGLVDDRGFIHPKFHRARPEKASEVIKLTAMNPAQQKEYKEWKKGQQSWKPPQAATKVPDIHVIIARVDNDSRKKPPLKRYTDEIWEDNCALCGDGGHLLLCECCNQVNHLKCVQKLFTVKEPGPNDDFLCHDCLQTAVNEGMTEPAPLSTSFTEKPKAEVRRSPALGKPQSAAKRAPMESNGIDVALIMKSVDNDMKCNGWDKRKLSLARYKDIVSEDYCALCRLGGNLFVCECCPRANHLKCLQRLHNVKRPGPKDDFLCSDCLDTAIREGIGGPPRVKTYCLRDRMHGFGSELYRLLEDGHYSEYIGWSQSGKSFIIPDKDAFIEHVSSKNGPQKWSDFQSGLNRQGFHSVNHNSAQAEISHPLLVRGLPQLADNIESMRGVPRETKHKMLKEMASKKYQEKLLQKSPSPKMRPSKPAKPTPAKVQKPSTSNPKPATAQTPSTSDKTAPDGDFVIQEGTYNLQNRRFGYVAEIYRLLEDAHKEGFEDVIAWLEDGSSFQIHSQEVFVNKILTSSSKQSSFASFVKALSQQDFHKKHGQDVFWHFALKRGHPELSKNLEFGKYPSSGEDESSDEESGDSEAETSDEEEEEEEDSSEGASLASEAEDTGPIEAISRLSVEKCGLDFDEDFSAHLYVLLKLASDDSNVEGLGKILSWQKSGEVFEIHSISLMKELLKHCTRKSTASGNELYSNFLRSLTQFEFQYVRNNPESGWRLDLFQRDCPDAVEWIESRPLSQNGTITSIGEKMPIFESLGELLESKFSILERLHFVLTNADDFGFSHNIISWRDGGKSFLIHDRTRFEEDVLPFISSSTWKNFSATLSRHVIRRKEAGTDWFEHSNFRRDKPELVAEIPSVRKDRRPKG